MSKRRILPYLLVVLVPIGLFLASIAVFLVLSAAVWNQAETEDFLARLPFPFGYTMENLRRQQIKSEGVRLVLMLNDMGVTAEDPQPQAKVFLRRLMVLSGEDFGTGFKAGGSNENWEGPASPEEWGDVMDRVNTWSDEYFGTDFAGSSSSASDGSEYYPDPSDSEPEPTYELPEDNAPPSYSPEPLPEPPPVDEDYDPGEVIDPDYNENDSYQPEE